MRQWIYVALALAALFILAGCSSQQSPQGLAGSSYAPAASYYGNSSADNRNGAASAASSPSKAYYANATAGDDNNRNGKAGTATSASNSYYGNKVTPANTSQTTAQPTQAGAAKEFTMTASQFAFSPSTISVSKGDTVILHMTAQDTSHGFELDGFNINQALPPGKTITVQFLADKTGTFEFHCNIPCGPGHQEMHGELIVN